MGNRTLEGLCNRISEAVGAAVTGGHLDGGSSMRFDFDKNVSGFDAESFGHDIGYPAKAQGHSLFVYKYDNDPRLKGD